VINRTGEKLPLYTGLYYAISNKRSGYTWANKSVLVPSLDPRNASHWHKFEVASRSSNAYDMSNDIDNYFEKVDENYYRIVEVSSGEPCVDGKYFNGSPLEVRTCTSCSNKFKNEFQWKSTEMPDYKLNAIMNDFQYEIPLQVI